MERDAFLARVRAATGGRPPEGRPEFLAPSPVREDNALLVEMAARWRRPHAEWHQVSATDAGRTVVEILTGARLNRIAVSAHPLLAALEIPQALRAAGLVLLDLPQSLEAVHRDVAGADAGLTVPAYGVAETGTLVEVAHPRQPRSLSLLPPFHVAVLPVEALLPTLDDLFAALGATRPDHTLSFISGPSGTADIGLQHVTGVHGPRDVHLIVVERRRDSVPGSSPA